VTAWGEMQAVDKAQGDGEASQTPDGRRKGPETGNGIQSGEG